MPSSTRWTGKPTSLIAANSSLSRLSRLTVIRRSPASPERPRLARQRRAVGGHRQVPEPGDPREHLDKPLQLAAHERLAAGQADLLHPMVTNKDPREPLGLLKRQKLGTLEELVVVPSSSRATRTGTSRRRSVSSANA